MTKFAKSAPAKGDISSPVKGGGGPVQKFKPSPKKPSPKKEGDHNKVDTYCMSITSVKINAWKILCSAHYLCI